MLQRLSLQLFLLASPTLDCLMTTVPATKSWSARRFSFVSSTTSSRQFHPHDPQAHYRLDWGAAEAPHQLHLVEQGEHNAGYGSVDGID